MIQLEKSPSCSPNLILSSGNDCQWMLYLEQAALHYHTERIWNSLSYIVESSLFFQYDTASWLHNQDMAVLWFVEE